MKTSGLRATISTSRSGGGTHARFVHFAITLLQKVKLRERSLIAGHSPKSSAAELKSGSMRASFRDECRELTGPLMDQSNPRGNLWLSREMI